MFPFFQYLPSIILAANEICLHRTLGVIKKLMSEAGGKILAEDLEIVSRLQESFREVLKANSSKGSNFIEKVLSFNHCNRLHFSYDEKCNLIKQGHKNEEVRSSPKSAEIT